MPPELLFHLNCVDTKAQKINQSFSKRFFYATIKKSGVYYMNHYYPNEDVLVEIVSQFNKRNETTIGYLRNQYLGLECYATAYCKDHNKFLTTRDGRNTGINYKFRQALFDAVSSARGVGRLLNSRDVNTLAHFSPFIVDDDSGSSIVHEEFIESYRCYLSNPLDLRAQKDAFVNLCKLLYLVRCNSAHTGKASFGPNRSKIERDNSIARLMVNINLLIFNIIMDHPDRKLACYGTLIDSPYVERFSALDGKVNGYLETSSEGLTYFTYELGTGVVSVKLYKSQTAIEFADIDAYEGNSYERIYIPVKCANDWHVANIYERKYFYE